MAEDQDLDGGDDDVCVRFVIPAGSDETSVTEALSQVIRTLHLHLHLHLHCPGVRGVQGGGDGP